MCELYRFHNFFMSIYVYIMIEIWKTMQTIFLE